MAGCRQVHKDWTYMLWTDENISQVHGNGSLVNQVWFDRFQSSKNLLSDISRFEILLAFGGVYVDVDTECLRPFEGFHDRNHECWAGREMEVNTFAEFKVGLLNSANMGCVRGSRVMEEMVRNLKFTDWSKMAWISAGPYYFTRITQQLNLSVQVMPYNAFYPYHHTTHMITELARPEERVNLIASGVYAIHHWGTSHSNYHLR